MARPEPVHGPRAQGLTANDLLDQTQGAKKSVFATSTLDHTLALAVARFVSSDRRTVQHFLLCDDASHLVLPGPASATAAHNLIQALQEPQQLIIRPIAQRRAGLLLGCGLNVVALEEGVFGIR